MIINNDTVAKQQSMDLSSYVKFRITSFNPNNAFASCNNSSSNINNGSTSSNIASISTYSLSKTNTSGREYIYPNLCYFSILYNTSYVSNAHNTNSYNQRILVMVFMYSYSIVQNCLCFVNGQISTKYGINNISYDANSKSVTLNCNLSNIYNHRYIATAIFSDYGN